MKRIFTLLIVLVIPLITNAQKLYRKFSVGVGTGLAYNHGDLRGREGKEVYMGNLEYFFTPYIVGNGELQVGNMAGYGLETNRYFRSDFRSVTGNLKLYMGRLTDKFRGPYAYKTKLSQLFEGLYAGAGVGMIKSTQQEIYRQKDNDLYRGWDTDRDLIVPVSVGLDNSSFNSRVVAGVRYQYAFGLGDNMDGYAIKGSARDMYSTISVSLKYRFGSEHRYFQ